MNSNISGHDSLGVIGDKTWVANLVPSPCTNCKLGLVSLRWNSSTNEPCDKTALVWHSGTKNVPGIWGLLDRPKNPSNAVSSDKYLEFVPKLRSISLSKLAWPSETLPQIAMVSVDFTAEGNVYSEEFSLSKKDH